MTRAEAITPFTATQGAARAGADVQRRAPELALGLSRAGVTGVEKVIRIRDGQLFHASLDCYVDLGSEQKGAHMSRFEEVVNEAIGQVVLSEAPFRAETLAQHIAELVRERQEARRAEVSIAARYPEHKPAPVSGVQTQEIYTLHGRAVAFAHGTRTVVGVSASGMTACPCAQELVAGARPRTAARRWVLGRRRGAHPRARARRDPQPARPRHARNRLPRESRPDRRCRTLLAIVESSFSSEIYELMKRVDEVEVVEKAHRQPRFVEDCVREMMAGVLRELPELDGACFVSARQENLETIHQHNVLAERFGLLSEIRGELESGIPTPRQTTLAEWLEGIPAAVS